MKLAVVLSGEVRHLDRLLETHKYLSKDNQVDYYCTVWERDQDKLDVVNKLNPVSIQTIEEDNELLLSSIDVEKEIIKKFKKNPIFMLPRIELLSKITYLNIPKVEEYDFILRSRYDIEYCTEMPFHLAKEQPVFQKAYGNTRLPGNVPDGFFLATPEHSRILYNFYEWIVEDCVKELPANFEFNPEATFGHYVRNVCNFNPQIVDQLIKPLGKGMAASKVERKVNRAKRYLFDLAKYHKELYDSVEFFGHRKYGIDPKAYKNELREFFSEKNSMV